MAAPDPVLADAGYHVLAPDQRGYGHSSAPRDVDGVRHPAPHRRPRRPARPHGKDDAIFVGHDWGALIVWDMARLQPERVRAVVGVSVPFVSWPAAPTTLMRSVYGDRFFYILYFQQAGPAERELDADLAPRWRRCSTAPRGQASRGAPHPPSCRPMEGTGFLTNIADPPPLPYTGPEGRG